MLLLAFVLGCAPTQSTAPTLDSLQTQDSKSAGKALRRAPLGLNRLDDATVSHDLALVAVHGFDSRGSEWVQPLTTLAQHDAQLYFYNWNDKQCPETGAEQLARALDALLQEQPQLERLVLVGHSYGGVITGTVAQSHSLARPAQANIVASPIGQHPQLEKLCGFTGLADQSPQGDTSWRQFRTVHEQDGAFKDLEVDPQDVTLPELEVVQLPGEWEGGRLGHNRSVQWVAENGALLAD